MENLSAPLRFQRVVLCLDSEAVRCPETVGLGGEELLAQAWLTVVSSGCKAREHLRSVDVESESWIVSSDDVDPINLAAAVKRDHRSRRVCLVAFRDTGSLRSRASSAGIDVVLGLADFVAGYREKQRRWVEAESKPMSSPASAELPRAEASGFGVAPGAVVSNSGAGPSAAAARPLGAFGAAPCPASGTSGQAGAWPKPADDVPFSVLPQPFAPDFTEASVMQRPVAAAPLGVVPPVGACAPMPEQTGQKAQRFAFGAGSAMPCASTAAAPGAPMSAAASVPSRSAFIMPVISGSGGSGKSTVSVLAALLSSKIGYRTVLVDFDLQFGDVLYLTGRDDALRVDEAIENPTQLSRLDADQASFPSIIGAPRRLERAEVVAGGVPQLLDALRGRFDVVIANTGSLWGEQHAAVLERCSKALFLVDQRPSSLRACQHALELCARCGIATSPFLFAVNRCSRGALYTSIDVSCALRGAQAVELADGGPDVEESLSAGRPEDLIGDRNELCDSVGNVLEGVLPGCAERLLEIGASHKPRGLFGRRRGRGRTACL